MAKMVEEMSDGRLTIRIDSANKHKSALGIFDFVKSGQYQMGHSASYYSKGKDFNTLFFTTVPFGMTAFCHSQAVILGYKWVAGLEKKSTQWTT